MKTLVNKCGLLPGLLLCSALTASAVQVTYQVDMSVQMTLGNFNPGNGDTVLVSGDFNGWGTADVLTASGDPNIYTITLDQTALIWPNYQFVINPFGTSSGGDLKWETAVGNRWFQVPTTATNLPVVFWNNVTDAGSVVTTPITFQVNMGVQANLGNFNPATDFVFVAGDFNWSSLASPLTQSTEDPDIWSGTYNVTAVVGTTINFKFIKNTMAGGELWESDGVGPNGAQNRQFALPATATNLPSVYFNNVGTTVVTPVTFAVNLAVEIARGNFNPDADSVYVSGDTVNSWNEPGSQLTRTTTNLSVWTGTFSLTNTPGNTVNYKYVMNNVLGIAWEANGIGPGGAQNRQFPFPVTSTNLAAAYWNNVGTLGTLTNTTSGTDLNLTWAAGPLIRLQSAASATGPWTDVPDTLGVGSFSTNKSSGMNLFRLIGP